MSFDVLQSKNQRPIQNTLPPPIKIEIDVQLEAERNRICSEGGVNETKLSLHHGRFDDSQREASNRALRPRLRAVPRSTIQFKDQSKVHLPHQ